MENTGTGISRRGFIGAAAGTLGAAALAATTTQTVYADEATAEEEASASEDWLGTEPEVAEDEIVSVEETDLLIIGAGNAGLVAAATAVDAGMDFILCEQNSIIGDTRMWIGAVNTSYHEAEGLSIDKGRLVNELSRYASGMCKQEVIKVWVNESAELMAWLDPMMEEAGATCTLHTHDESSETGGTYYYVPVTHHMYDGADRHTVLQAHIEDAGNEIRFGYSLVKLVHADGAVTGAIFETTDGYVQVNATNTMLCTGGYAGNPTMMRALQPIAVSCCTANSFAATDRGMGLKAGLWAGGVKDPAPAPMIFDRGPVAPGTDAGYADDSDTATFPSQIMQLGLGSQPFMKVSRNGVRFANESTPYDFICLAASKQPGGVWCMVFDGNAADDVSRFMTIGCSAGERERLEAGSTIEDLLSTSIEYGYTQVADTIDELADLLGFEGDAKEAFLAQVERYNELYELQEDEDFGKEAYRLSAIAEPPFYGTWMGGALLTTIDGLQIDEDMHVLDENGDVIEGLYAAGDVSGCFFANNYPEYIVGVACGRTMTEARHTVRKLAGEI